MSIYVKELDHTYASTEDLVKAVNIAVSGARDNGVDICYAVDENGEESGPWVVNTRADALEEELKEARAVLARMEPLIIIAEEASGVIEAASRAARLGYDVIHQNEEENTSSETNTGCLNCKIGDLISAIGIASIQQMSVGKDPQSTTIAAMERIHEESGRDFSPFEQRLNVLQSHMKYFDLAATMEKYAPDQGLHPDVIAMLQEKSRPHN